MMTITRTDELMDGVRAAIEEIRPSLALHGGNAELVAIEDGVVRLKLGGACADCPLSVITFGVALKELLLERFPDKIKDVEW